MLAPPTTPLGLLPQQKPTILGITFNRSTSSPLTLTYPASRAARNGAIAFLNRSFGGAAAPSLPTGWTNLATSTTNPDFRVCYKALDGSEAPTFTSTASSATTFGGICMVFGGVNFAAAPPQHGGIATATSTTPNPGSLASTFTGKNILWLPYWMGNGGGPTLGWPGETVGRVEMVTEAIGVAWAHSPISTKDFAAFAITSSVTNRGGVVAVQAF